MNAQKQVRDALQGQAGLAGSQVQPAVRAASEEDFLNAHASPARQYQAWLEQALEEAPPERFSLRARATIIIGGSAALWIAIGWLIYRVVR